MKKDLPFELVFYDATRFAKKIPQSDYLSKGYYPILDQGKKYISGYYNDNSGLFSDVPAIIFGDHTRIIKFITSPCFIGADGVKLLKFKTKDDPKYLYYALQSLKIPNTGYNRHFRFLKEAKIRIWPKNIQEEIVLILDNIKSIIEKKNRQIENIDMIAKSRFIEMFGDPILNPMGWAISHYGDEFEIMSGGTPKTDIPEYWVNGKISWIGSNLCQNSVLIENDGKFITEKGLNNSSAKIFNKGYILIALVGATIGKVAHLKFSTSTNQNIAGINVPQNENYIPEFVFYNTQFLYPKFMDIGNSKFKMANLSFIRSLQIPIVPIKAQKKFSNFVEQLDKSKFRAKKCLKLFSCMRHLWKIEI